MKTSRLVQRAVAACAVTAAAHAVPVPYPTYTFCEEEGNDTCPDAQVLDASAAAGAAGGGADGESVRDCFYITGKLQQDCVWGIEPKCAINVYDKRKPCRDDDGHVIPSQFYEPILAMSTGGDLVVPASQYPERVLRLGVAALFDQADGTINGLAGNGPHREIGEVTVKIFHGAGGGGGLGEPDQSYVFRFGDDGARLPAGDQAMDLVQGPADAGAATSVTGTDAVRAAFLIPQGVGSVRVVCCTDTGTVPLCWDVDFYEIRNLIPSAFYSVEQIGGLTDVTDVDNQPDCAPTNTKLGWFDKQCFLINKDDASGSDSPAVGASFAFPKLYLSADEHGTIRIGVSGGQRYVEGLVAARGDAIPDRSGAQPGTLECNAIATPKDPSDADLIIRSIGFASVDIAHPWVGDLKITISHVETGESAVLFDRPGIPPVGFGSGADLKGAYIFADAPFEGSSIDDFEDASGPPSPPEIPVGTYRSETPLSVFAGESPYGTWRIRVTDHAPGQAGALAEWRILFNIAIEAGDCDFDGLRDDRQWDYYDLLEEINLFTDSEYVYTPGASAKDASVGGVNRYPRTIWDPFHSSTNPDGFDFLDLFGGPPERWAAHGVCGGYCLKVQLAEHAPSRPPFPVVLHGRRVDMDQDGVINATDLALLLSYWGVVQ